MNIIININDDEVVVPASKLRTIDKLSVLDQLELELREQKNRDRLIDILDHIGYEGQ